MPLSNLLTLFFQTFYTFSDNIQNAFKNNVSLQDQSLLLNDTDVISDDEYHICTRVPKDTTPFTPDDTLNDETFATITNPRIYTLYRHPL